MLCCRDANSCGLKGSDLVSHLSRPLEVLCLDRSIQFTPQTIQAFLHLRRRRIRWQVNLSDMLHASVNTAEQLVKVHFECLIAVRAAESASLAKLPERESAERALVVFV